MLLDWFPFHGGFHLSGGALIYDGNNLHGAPNVPLGQQFSLGSQNFYSSSTDPKTGTGKLDFRTAAPEVRVGWGNLVPRSHDFSFTLEGGVGFMHKPQTQLALGGTACLDATQTLCVPAATDPIIQQQRVAEQNKINNNAKYAQFWPIIAMTFGCRF